MLTTSTKDKPGIDNYPDFVSLIYKGFIVEFKRSNIF